MTDVIYTYTIEQAVEDGILLKPFDDAIGMNKHVDNKPVVATTHLFTEISFSDLLEIWYKFLVWRARVMPTLPEEDRMFSMEVNGKKVWVDETPYQVTLLYPEDY